jgi:DNA-binding response OmpR family regulator
MADRVDVAIVDNSLPDGDGAGFAATLRRRGSLRSVILTTTDRTGELEERAAHAGLDAVLEKPFELSRVLALIEGACGSS